MANIKAVSKVILHISILNPGNTGKTIFMENIGHDN